LGEGEEHIEGQPSHRGRGVELLRDRDERHTHGIEDLDDLGKIGEGTREAIDLVNNDDIDFALADVAEKLLQRRPLHITARAAAIVIGLRQRGPALMELALDEGLAGFPLSVQ
jgi:hypothetical protein